MLINNNSYYFADLQAIQEQKSPSLILSLESIQNGIQSVVNNMFSSFWLPPFRLSAIMILTAGTDPFVHTFYRDIAGGRVGEYSHSKSLQNQSIYYLS